MVDWQKYLIFIPLAYIIGSINFAVIIAAIKNKDIRQLGSGNPGTMNMLRSVGKFWGCLTFVLDAAKGICFALIGKFLFDNYALAVYVLGFAAVLGHIFSCFSRLSGGKGVATTLGAYAVITPITFAVAFVAMIVYLAFCKKGFIGSLMAISICSISSIVLLSVFRPTYFYISLVLIIVWWALIFWTHRENIKRTLKKCENSLSLFGKDDNEKEC